MTEAIEAAAILREHGLPVAAAVLNAVRSPRFTSDDAPALTRAFESASAPVREAARAALEHLGHQQADTAYRDRLGSETGLPVIDLPEVIARHFDVAALARLADALAADVADTAGAA